MFDLDSYLARIGLSGRPTLAEVHRAHITSIPFENLDPQRGVPVSLALEDLQRKLVDNRRGGYCFEMNLLLKAALESLGADVEMLLARVRRGSDPATVRPRTHLVLRVRSDGGDWHADVGFGLGSLLAPIPFGPGGPHDQAGWRYRVVEDGPELVLQLQDGDAWRDLYGFVSEPVPIVDVEVSNWFTSTHPRSPFVTGLIVSTQQRDGTRTSLSDWGDLALTEQTPARRTVTPLDRDQVPALLGERFGLEGFALSAGGHLELARASCPPHHLR
jgi:N-hydroxyarylamine O-acetyltransferase